ncbi:glutathione S-transferase APIC-like isoform X2 [Salvia splendens]|uniref:glutathione S-transferase APIC-like isoform X2 n=1 Tax=Salvia splendens TaxID=180675 RepID=UPI001C26AA5D|nr:glutathione S-transferase APIC-like isoform X2 [Salvia splendens]
MAAAVKVYGPPFSTAVARVMVTLLEKDVPFQLLPVNMAKAEHKKPDYLKIQVSFLFAQLTQYLICCSHLDKSQHFKMRALLSLVKEERREC